MELAHQNGLANMLQAETVNGIKDEQMMKEQISS